jgi:hypothetical protein
MNSTSSPSSARATTTIRTMKTSPGQRRKLNRWAIFQECYTFRANQGFVIRSTHLTWVYKFVKRIIEVRHAGSVYVIDRCPDPAWHVCR